MKESQKFFLLVMVLVSPRMSDGWALIMAGASLIMMLINAWLESRS